MQTSDKKTIKRIGEIISLFAIMLVIILAGSCILDPLRTGSVSGTSELDRYILEGLLQPENSIDVVIVGDSDAHFTFDMELLNGAGINSYMFTRGGLTPVEAFFTMKKVYEKQEPSLVIIETSMMVEDQPETSSVRTGILQVFNAYVYEYMPVFRYHLLWENMLEQKADEPVENYKGFSKRTGVAPYTGGEYMFPTGERSRVNFIRYHYMDKILKLCGENGSEVILVSAPAPAMFDSKKHNTVSYYAGEKGVEYIDFNTLQEELSIDWSADTLDNGYHLNLSGADKVTGYLVNYLASR